jgi:hypothetical protein
MERKIVGLPLFRDNKGELFAKNENVHLISSSGRQMDFQYGGNVIIGPGRTFADMLSVVYSLTWSSMNGKVRNNAFNCQLRFHVYIRCDMRVNV